MQQFAATRRRFRGLPRSGLTAHVAPELSPFCEHDATEFALAASKSKSFHHGWVYPPTTTSEAEELARRRQGPADFGYLIRDQESGKAAGYIEITNIVRGPLQSGYLGYYMFEGYERRGYMKWALGVIIQRAWKELKLHRLEANIQPGNTASIELVRALGFLKEGYSPEYLKLGGRWRDHERWAIQRDGQGGLSSR
ncbi:MAG: GNAT family N-acetyltransferase [Sterolibacteriaceae bacterium]|nr:GNAT family N-acetyltransferase [Candidatus Methylophosphatis haderslevensis]